MTREHSYKMNTKTIGNRVVTMHLEGMEKVDGVWKFARIELNATVTIENELTRDKLAKAIEMAHNFCPIRNSLAITSILKYEILVE